MAQDHEALIALGSNLGDRAAHLHQAVQALGSVGKVADTSFLYETAPILLEHQPWFLNAACRLLTPLGPRELLRALQQIEQDMGRVKTVRYGPRIIDLDLAFLGDCILEELPFIQLPHYQAAQRDFVLEPLCDMVPDFVNPQTGLTLQAERDKLGRSPLPQILPVGKQIWRLQEKTRVVGILNVSPESSLVPGRIPEDAAAKATLARQIAQMEAAGADLIDIGAQTSRPRHALIPAAEEVRRLTAAFDVARAATTLPLSVDTFRSTAAKAALACGADVINDVWAGRFDPALLDLSAQAGIPHIFVYNNQRVRDPAYPGRLRNLRPFAPLGDVAAAVRRELEEALAAARGRGQCRWLQVTDPGLGFGKNLEQNAALLGDFGAGPEWRYPVMSGSSRKGFLRQLASSGDAGPLQTGSLAAAVIASRTAHMVRVHDVADTTRALRVADAVWRQTADDRHPGMSSERQDAGTGAFQPVGRTPYPATTRQ